MSIYKKARVLARDGKKPLDIAAALGIRVLFLPLKTVSGMAISLGKEMFILIDQGLSEIEQQLVCGHELGHFFLHPATNFLFVLEKTGFYSKHEYQANRFACELVLGETAQLYECEIKEAAARGKLKEMAEVIRELAGRGESVP